MGSLEQRAAEKSQVATSFGRAVERNTHAIQEVNDLWCPVRHRAHWRLVGQEVAPVEGFIAVLVFRVPLLPGHFVARVDASLRAHAVRSLDRHQREKIDLQT